MRLKLLCLLATFPLFSRNVNANVTLPKLISDNMVLQRETPLKIWGWADVGEKVTVSFKGKSYPTIAPEKGKWEVTIPAQKPGGPFDLTVKGNNAITVSNVLIGDVWFCGGQSNMEMIFDDMPKEYKPELAQAQNNNIRILTVKRHSSYVPVNDIGTLGWETANQNTLQKFSAVAYFFGREVNTATKVPIGLISCSWGGTPAEAWTSADGLKDFPEYLNLFNKRVDTSNKETLTNEEQERNWLKNQKDQINASLSDTIMATNLGNTENWPVMQLPSGWNTEELAKFDGVIWFTRDIEIPETLAGKELTLNSPPIDDMDHTYFNGQKIGFTDGYNIPRKYIVPANLVKLGKNTISIRVTDYYLGGGMTGAKEELYLKGNDNLLYLSGKWKYKITDTFNIPARTFFKDDPNVPSVLQKGMLSPIQNYAIKGAIWYQGEANAGRAVEYRKIFPALINDWRKAWGYEFPFIYVQLANFISTDDWPMLREAQAMTLALPKTAMAVTIDIGEANNIHPKNKLDVGKRLALAARKVAYNENIVFSGPMFESLKIEDNKIRVVFSNIGGGLTTKGDNLNCFEIASEDKVFVKANAQIEANAVVVSNTEVKQPKFVRYAWAPSPINPNLYNKEGLPAVPFRSDK